MPNLVRLELNAASSRITHCVTEANNRFADPAAIDELQAVSDALPQKETFPPTELRLKQFSGQVKKKEPLIQHVGTRLALALRVKRPIAEPTDFQDRLNKCIAEINHPGYVVRNSSKIQADLSAMVGESFCTLQAHLWLGIIKRINGKNAEPEFNFVLRHEPQNRMAFLNLAALSFTFNSGFFAGQPEWKIEKEKVTKRFLDISGYVEKFPQDCFARLILSTFLSWRGKTMLAREEELEQLYLDWPDYTPASALLSYEFFSGIRSEAALDFAKEALAKCPTNLLAARIIVSINEKQYQKAPKSGGFVVKKERKEGSPSIGEDLIFKAPYRFQDPCWRSDVLATKASSSDCGH